MTHSARALGIVVSAGLAACEPSPAPPVAPFCVAGFVPVPVVYFVYPGGGQARVSTSIGELVFAGATSGYRVRLTGPGQVHVHTGPLGPAPSPLPSPIVQPPPIDDHFSSVSVPPLAPATTYAVTVSYTGITNDPADCVGTVTRHLGSFTTAGLEGSRTPMHQHVAR